MLGRIDSPNQSSVNWSTRGSRLQPLVCHHHLGIVGEWPRVHCIKAIATALLATASSPRSTRLRAAHAGDRDSLATAARRRQRRRQHDRHRHSHARHEAGGGRCALEASSERIEITKDLDRCALSSQTFMRPCKP